MATVVFMALSSAVWAAIPSDVLRESLHPQGNVNDFAGILSQAERTSLESQTIEFRRKTSAQFAVVIVKSLEGGQIDDFTNKLFAQWGVGEKKKDNGVMLLVALQERKARIEVGYGLEPILPDALAGRVLDELLFPAFKQRRYAEGLNKAVARIAQIIERNEPASAEKQKEQGKLESDPSLIALLFLLLIAVAFAFTGSLVAGRKRDFSMGTALSGGVLMTIASLVTEVAFGYWFMLAAIAFIVGLGAQRTDRGGRRYSDWTSGWTGGSSGWNDGGFGGGGFGGGGFGGGCSGGGGASGGW